MNCVLLKKKTAKEREKNWKMKNEKEKEREYEPQFVHPLTNVISSAELQVQWT